MLDVMGPTELSLGQPLNCQIRVRNPSSEALSGVRVEAPMPEGVRPMFADPTPDNLGDRLAWRLGNMEPGGERTIRLEVMPTQPGELHLMPVASFAAAMGLRTRVTRPPFSASISSAESAAPGSTVRFNIQLTNHQTVRIERVQLRVLLGFDLGSAQQADARVEQALLRRQLPVGLDHEQGNVIEADIGPLEAGQTRTVQLPARAVRPGRWATVVHAFGEGVPDTRSQGMIQITQQALVLKLDGPNTGALHQEQVFQLTVSNPSEQPAQKVQLTQVIPDGLEYLGGSTAGSFNPTTHEIRWQLERLEPRQQQTVTFRTRARAVNDWALSALVTAEAVADARATCAIHIGSAPTLTAEVIPLDDPIEYGSEATYEVRVANQGPAAGEDVRLALFLPDVLLPGVPLNSATRATVQGQSVFYEPLAQLGPRDVAVYRIRVRGLRPGQGQFRAVLSARGLPTPLSQEITSHVRTGSAVRAYQANP
jgi:uncharacterized repeat protein (TIGR01451 family)